MSDLHKGHRKRLKAKYLSNGVDSLEEHEALELLLYYAIPQRDTNPLAHELLEKTGSLSTLFDSPMSYLQSIGLSEHVAVLLKLIPDLTRLYMDSKSSDKYKMFELKDACDFFKTKFIGRTEEVLYLLLLDGKGKNVFCGIVSKGSINTTDVPIRKIVELALLYNACSVIIAHNHPSGLALPSSADIETTKKIFNALQVIGVRLLDHIIVSDTDEVSLFSSMYRNMVFVADSD